jgi:hypothetical protein
MGRREPAEISTRGVKAAPHRGGGASCLSRSGTRRAWSAAVSPAATRAGDHAGMRLPADPP